MPAPAATAKTAATAGVNQAKLCATLPRSRSRSAAGWRHVRRGFLQVGGCSRDHGDFGCVLLVRIRIQRFVPGCGWAG